MVPYDLNSVFIVARRAAARSQPGDFDSGKAMVGTGPFKFVRFARGDRVELARNDAYWGAQGGKSAAWEKVTFRIVPTDPARLAGLLSGDLDAIEQVPTADLPRIRRDARLQTAQKVSWRTIFFHLDQQHDRAPGLADKAGTPLARNPFRDPRVRRALSKAINRPAIAERLMDGAAIPASNLVSPPVFGYAPDLKPEPYDPDGAKRLLAGAGYPDGFAMTLAATNNRYVNDEQIAQAVAQMLARVGVRARVETLPLNAYLPKGRKGEFAFAMFGWGSFSADLALRALVATPDPDKGFGAFNWSGYSNRQVDALLERAFASVDEKRREALARDAMRLDRARPATKRLGGTPLHPHAGGPCSVRSDAGAHDAAPGRGAPGLQQAARGGAVVPENPGARPGQPRRSPLPRRDTRRLRCRGGAGPHGPVHGAAGRSRSAAAARADASRHPPVERGDRPGKAQARSRPR